MVDLGIVKLVLCFKLFLLVLYCDVFVGEIIGVVWYLSWFMFCNGDEILGGVMVVFFGGLIRCCLGGFLGWLGELVMYCVLM